MLTAWFVPWLAGVSDYVLLQHGGGGSSPAYGLNMEHYPLAPSASPKHTDTYMLAHMCTQTHTQHTYRLQGCLGILVRLDRIGWQLSQFPLGHGVSVDVDVTKCLWSEG